MPVKTGLKEEPSSWCVELESQRHIWILCNPRMTQQTGKAIAEDRWLRILSNNSLILEKLFSFNI